MHQQAHQHEAMLAAAAAAGSASSAQQQVHLQNQEQLRQARLNQASNQFLEQPAEPGYAPLLQMGAYPAAELGKAPPTHYSPAAGVAKPLAHSTSLLASARAGDAYLGGMASDSELATSAARHHSSGSSGALRPQPGQSRVYHAHSAPRTGFASQSRLSHYSDSAAYPGSAASPRAQRQQRLAAASLGYASLGDSVSALASPAAGHSSAGYSQRPASGDGACQLPAHPFVHQSVSIDQHPKQAGFARSAGLPPPAPTLSTLLAGCSDRYPAPASASLEQQQRFERQRLFRHEMEALEKRAAAIGLGVAASEAAEPSPRVGQRMLPDQELVAAAQQQPPSDWFAGRSGQLVPRPAGLFKQAMSVDQQLAGYPAAGPQHYRDRVHYPALVQESQQQQQQQQQSALFYRGNYAPATPSYLPGCPRDRPPVYQSAAGAVGDQQSQSQPQPQYQSQHNEMAGYHHFAEPHSNQQQPPQQAQPCSAAEQSFGSRGAAQTGAGADGLQHQVSSGSSNSGSLGWQPAPHQSPAEQQAGAGHALPAVLRGAPDKGGVPLRAVLKRNPRGQPAPGAGEVQSDCGEQRAPGQQRSLGQASSKQRSLASGSQGYAAEATYQRQIERQQTLAGFPGAAAAAAAAGPSSTRSESSSGLPNGPSSSSSGSLTKKSNSATQLSMSGTKKRMGFRKKQVTSFSVHRSEEVGPLDGRHLVKQGSSVSEGESSLSGDSSSRSWSNSNFKQPTSEEAASMSFIDGLGKGQMISRQGLASPYLGDIQLSLCDRRGNLEVEVIRARNLQAKANKILPLTYVKLYLVKNRKCLAKAKTTLCNKRTLDPLFQQQLTFHEDYHGSILQSIVWGNFGKMDKKNFMGIAQISMDDLDLSDTVLSWYKLFLPSSLQTLPSKSLRHTLLSNSSESFTTNTNNS